MTNCGYCGKKVMERIKRITYNNPFYVNKEFCCIDHKHKFIFDIRSGKINMGKPSIQTKLTDFKKLEIS